MGDWATQIPAYLLAFVVFAGQLAYGANSTPLSLLLATAWFAILAGMTLNRSIRAALRTLPLVFLATPFAIVLALAALSLTPWALGGPHPVWTWVPSAPPTGASSSWCTNRNS